VVCKALWNEAFRQGLWYGRSVAQTLISGARQRRSPFPISGIFLSEIATGFQELALATITERKRKSPRNPVMSHATSSAKSQARPYIRWRDAVTLEISFSGEAMSRRPGLNFTVSLKPVRTQRNRTFHARDPANERFVFMPMPQLSVQGERRMHRHLLIGQLSTPAYPCEINIHVRIYLVLRRIVPWCRPAKLVMMRSICEKVLADHRPCVGLRNSKRKGVSQHGPASAIRFADQIHFPGADPRIQAKDNLLALLSLSVHWPHINQKAEFMSSIILREKPSTGLRGRLKPVTSVKMPAMSRIGTCSGLRDPLNSADCKSLVVHFRLTIRGPR
jgi:hypothetical protein